MAGKARIYVRKDGTRVAASGRPVDGQLRFVAASRTAIDGRSWWCVFDNEGDRYLDGKYKTRSECEAAITRRLRKGELPYIAGGSPRGADSEA